MDELHGDCDSMDRVRMNFPIPRGKNDWSMPKLKVSFMELDVHEDSIVIAVAEPEAVTAATDPLFLRA